MRVIINFFLGMVLCLSSVTAAFASSNLGQHAATAGFIQQMQDKHQFSAGELQRLFDQATLQQTALDAIQRPYESKPWSSYRPLFLTDTRVNQGLEFWQQNQELLQRAEDEYGVPASIIVSIIGVETSYGRNQGSYRVLDTLATLAFEFPRRADFFRKELEEFLLLTRENNLDPLSVYGSYAGAIGKAQFIPSSYRYYAVDFTGSGDIDLRNNVADAIGSVANYLGEHGWQQGQPIAIPANVTGTNYQNLDYKKLKTTVPAKQLNQYGISPKVDIAPEQKVNLVELDGEAGKEYWLGLNNFYVITRYNISSLYAMAVFQLAEELEARSA